ncbi:hypothetical protein AHiyo4_38090 [Arthrobacter sp. Hiyo4]|nr:hypothetical protein AHiyo4_38090 [Arthrobacter sp. Hiyo4]
MRGSVIDGHRAAHHSSIRPTLELAAPPPPYCRADLRWATHVPVDRTCSRTTPPKFRNRCPAGRSPGTGTPAGQQQAVGRHGHRRRDFRLRSRCVGRPVPTAEISAPPEAITTAASPVVRVTRPLAAVPWIRPMLGALSLAVRELALRSRKSQKLRCLPRLPTTASARTCSGTRGRPQPLHGCPRRYGGWDRRPVRR